MYNLFKAHKVNSIYSKLTYYIEKRGMVGTKLLILRHECMSFALHIGLFTDKEHEQWFLSQKV